MRPAPAGGGRADKAGDLFPHAARLTYEAAGLRYDRLDPFKQKAQKAARATAPLLAAHGLAEVPESRGESAYAIACRDHYLVVNEEGLGTKNLVADATRRITGRTYYDAIARDTVATIVNDIAVLGARPLAVCAHVACGASEWFADRKRASDFVRGFAAACSEAGAVWAGGETPALAGIVAPETVVLSGSGTGLIRPKKRIALGSKIRPGDAILLVASSGIHTNGLTLARKVAERLPGGYAARLPDGTLYGEALLVPSLLYPRAVAALQDAGLDLHYLVHVTGHGWRKLMRADRDLTYVIDESLPVPPVFDFIRAQGRVRLREMYRTFNMGVGLAVYLPERHARRAVGVLAALGLPAVVGGRVEKGPRRVVIRPAGVVFEAGTLRIRVAR